MLKRRLFGGTSLVKAVKSTRRRWWRRSRGGGGGGRSRCRRSRWSRGRGGRGRSRRRRYANGSGRRGRCAIGLGPLSLCTGLCALYNAGRTHKRAHGHSLYRARRVRGHLHTIQRAPPGWYCTCRLGADCSAPCRRGRCASRPAENRASTPAARRGWRCAATGSRTASAAGTTGLPRGPSPPAPNGCQARVSVALLQLCTRGALRRRTVKHAVAAALLADGRCQLAGHLVAADAWLVRLRLGAEAVLVPRARQPGHRACAHPKGASRMSGRFR